MPLTILTVTDAPALPLEVPHVGAIGQRWRVTPEGSLVDGNTLAFYTLVYRSPSKSGRSSH